MEFAMAEECLDWNDPVWRHDAETLRDAAIASAGRPRTGPVRRVKTWGRSCIDTVPTERGTLWSKHAYRLPPGEEVVLESLAARWRDRVPHVIATWPGGIAMDPLPGRELAVTDPVDAWTDAARVLSEVAAGERTYVDAWLEAGVRDRRPPTWRSTVDALVESPVVRSIDADLLGRFEKLVPEFITRFVEAFDSPATLVHQDSGCCNIRVTDDGPILFDWADVVVGHPVFSCDRLLDQVPVAHRAAVIDAFRAPLGLPRHEFDAMRRSNVLHEIVRYHDELAYLTPNDPIHESLANSVRSQIGTLNRGQAFISHLRRLITGDTGSGLHEASSSGTARGVGPFRAKHRWVEAKSRELLSAND